ncbi:MAG TPA: hypothetical protein VMV12_02210 [Candidatus Micrarchaeaceae archaeon]|nr:hypothetical protein [Candidatus Micrarchaeaceae archaeon]
MNIRHPWRNTDDRSLPAGLAELPQAAAASGPDAGCGAQLAVPAAEASATAAKIPGPDTAAAAPQPAQVVQPGERLMMADSPETEAAVTRMAAIPAHLVPQTLRLAVLDAAARAAVVREARESVEDCLAAVKASLRRSDVAAARDVAKVLVAAERLIPMLTGVEVDPSAVAEALSSASNIIRQAIGQLQPVPELAYSLERAAWHALPVQMLPALPAPVALPSDLEAERARAELEAARSNLQRAHGEWESAAERGAEILGHLQAAGGLLEAVAELRGPLLAVAEQVRAANEARGLAGIAWQVPAGHTSEPIRRLEALRAAQTPEAVPV